MRKITIGDTIEITDDNGTRPFDPLDPVKSSEPLPALATEYFTGGLIKAASEVRGEIGGYLVNYGSRSQTDSSGEWFTPHTEYRLDYYDSRPVLFHHGLGDADSAKIGEIYQLTQDERGIYAHARLYLDHEDPQIRYYAQRAWSDIQAGKLFWSSGSVGHLVEKTYDGEITKWPLVEGSLTPTPAEPGRTKVSALKTACLQWFVEDAAPIEPTAKEDSTTKDTPTDTDVTAIPIKSKTRNRKGLTMLDNATIEALREGGLDDSQILTVIGVLGESAAAEPEMMAEEEDPVPVPDDEEVLRAAQPDSGLGGIGNGKSGSGGQHPQPPRLTPEYAMLLKRMERAESQLKQQRSAKPVETVPGRSDPRGTKAPILRGRNPYSHMSWQDMVFVKSLLDSKERAAGKRWTPSNPEAWVRELAYKVQDDKETRFEDAAIKSMAAIKTDEVNYSTLATFGDEFVPDLWRSILWETPRLDNPVFQQMQVIEMPSSPYNIPVEGADITIYAVSETKNETQLGINDSSAAIPDTQVGTSNTTITAGKLAARIPISNELVEDSIIPVAEHWRFKAVRAMEDARDFVILSADSTTGTTNINNSGGSIGATHRALYGGGDGLLHLPLVDATTRGVDMGGASPTLAKIRETRTKLNAALLADFGNLVYFCDPLTSVALASLDEAINFSINGDMSTFNTGMVGRLDNIPVYVTNQMSLALATGFVSSTAASNVYGRLLLVHIPSWYVGFRRDISSNMAYDPNVDAWSLVVSLRMGLARRSTDVASLLYDILV